MIDQEKNESRASYLLRVAAVYIINNYVEGTIDYDDTTCDGYCLSQELIDESECIE